MKEIENKLKSLSNHRSLNGREAHPISLIEEIIQKVETTEDENFLINLVSLGVTKYKDIYPIISAHVEKRLRELSKQIR